MKKILHLAILTSALALASGAAQANLVVNGDFEAGNSGFGSDYSYVAIVNQSSLYPEGLYAVDNNPNNGHNLFYSMGDHTTGSGNMMIVNGYTEGDKTVWSEDGIAVAMNTQYFFSAWVSSAYPASPAELNFSVNGTQIGASFIADPSSAWFLFYANWNSGANTSANLSMVNLNTEPQGNDFNLDDIVFDTARPNGGTDLGGNDVPEPATLALFGMGLAGLGLMRRRR